MILFSIFVNFNNHAQNSLENAILQYAQYQETKIDSLISFAEAKKSNTWLNLLPNISYNYSAITNNYSLSVGVNLNAYASYYQQNHRNKIEIQKLKFSYNEKLNNDILRIENDYLKLLIEHNDINADIQILENHTELMILYKEQYDKHQINLETFLKNKTAYETRIKSINKKVESYNQKATFFEKKISTKKSLESPIFLPRLALLNLIY